MTHLTTEYPLKLKSALRDMVWGGGGLQSLFKKGEPGRPIGESWEVSAREEAPSIVLNGPLEGAPLYEAQRLWGQHLSGFPNFRLLIKLISAKDKLSVQVHPSDAPGIAGKTEAWYILRAPKGARIICGMNRGAGKEDVLRGARGDEHALHSALSQVAVKTGDVVFIPAGTVHALTEGIDVYEVQQNSDITYRLYDWGRTGPNGQPRELHIERALECLKTGPAPKFPGGAALVRGHIKRRLMVACPVFALEIVSLTAPALLKNNGAMKCYTCLQGAGVVEGAHGFAFRAGDSFVVPAAMDGVLVRGVTRLICSYVPDIDALRKEFRLKGAGMGRVAGMR